MKKFLIILIAFMLMQTNVFAEEQTPFEENSNTGNNTTAKETFNKDDVVTYKTFKISHVDKAGKDKNELNIFTPLYGEASNTDSKGLEAVIVNNKVVKINRCNSYIPKNGYIVSGHGLAKKFMVKNLFEGADVDIDFAKGEFKVVTHQDNYMIEAVYRLNKAKDIMSKINENSIEHDNMEFYINKSEEILNRTKKLIQFEDYEKASEMAKDAMIYSDRAFYYSLAYNPNEFKGVWVSASQKTKEEVARDFDAVKHMYVNNIFIEVFKNGTTMYKSDVAKEYGLEEQNPDFAEFDAVDEWLRLAQLNNINVYFSYNTFNLGCPKQSTIDKNIVKVHQDWLIKHSAKSAEDYFLNPENQFVQLFLFDLLREATDKYDIQGVHINGLNMKDKQLEITSFVNKLVEKNYTSNLFINVYPYNMDVSSWKLNNNVILTPVLTSSDDEFTRGFLSTIKTTSNVKNIYPVYTQAYQDELPRKFFDQVAISRELGLNGIIIYDLDCMTKEFFTALRYCIFKEPSAKKGLLFERK